MENNLEASLARSTVPIGSASDLCTIDSTSLNRPNDRASSNQPCSIIASISIALSSNNFRMWDLAWGKNGYLAKALSFVRAGGVLGIGMLYAQSRQGS